MTKKLAIRLPLEHDAVSQYAGLTDYQSIAFQNLKMLLLPNPGERMIYADFGVGLMKYLFERNDAFTRSEISSKIYEQVDIWLPYIEIREINYHSSIEDPTVSEEYLGIKIVFNIIPINVSRTMVIDTSGEDITNLTFNFG